MTFPVDRTRDCTESNAGVSFPYKHNLIKSIGFVTFHDLFNWIMLYI